MQPNIRSLAQVPLFGQAHAHKCIQQCIQTHMHVPVRHARLLPAARPLAQAPAGGQARAARPCCMPAAHPTAAPAAACYTLARAQSQGERARTPASKARVVCMSKRACMLPGCMCLLTDWYARAPAQSGAQGAGEP